MNTPGPTPPAGLAAAPVQAWRDGSWRAGRDLLAEEVPVALVVNGVAHAVMLASPTDLEDFALGFGLTEGLIARPDEWRDLEVVPADGGLELRLEVSPACFHRFKARRRQLAGRTGCGLCGTEQLAEVHRPLARVPTVHVDPAAVARALQALPAHQPLQQRSGATHAAAWCTPDGALHCVREDVGRHNALDKLVGARVRAGARFDDGWVLLTSRASFEMVQKCAMVGIGALVAVSAPTALAVQTAQACDLALAGFARGQGLVVYHGAERFGTAVPACAAAPLTG